MTVANQVTIVRILLIPVFVGCAVYFAESLREGAPVDAYRWAAVVVFAVASISDALDGWIARRFSQASRLGRLLDPLADKGLLLAAILTLTLAPWEMTFPLWFPVLVIARDIFLVGGAFLIHHTAGRVEVRPHWTGKCATALQMVAVAWVLLHWTWVDSMVSVILAGAFTLLSGGVYLREGLRQLRATDHAKPDEPPPPHHRHRR